MDAKEKANLAVTAGRAWAERRAESLRGDVPAVDWPDLWTDADDGELPYSDEELEPGEREGLRLAASHAAHERWRVLVTEQRFAEAMEEEERDLEAEARSLEASLRDNLPPGVIVGRDGPRVYVRDEDLGIERTVTSLESAWRVLDEWGETRLPGI